MTNYPAIDQELTVYSPKKYSQWHHDRIEKGWFAPVWGKDGWRWVEHALDENMTSNRVYIVEDYTNTYEPVTESSGSLTYRLMEAKNKLKTHCENKSADYALWCLREKADPLGIYGVNKKTKHDEYYYINCTPDSEENVKITHIQYKHGDKKGNIYMDRLALLKLPETIKAQLGITKREPQRTGEERHGVLVMPRQKQYTHKLYKDNLEVFKYSKLWNDKFTISCLIKKRKPRKFKYYWSKLKKEILARHNSEYFNQNCPNFT